MATPEPNSPTTGITEHLIPKETEENYLKYNFRKMIETLKQEAKKISLK